MTDSDDAVFARMRTRINVLFLGQEHLSIETGKDPLLAQVAEKYGGVPPLQGYDVLLSGVPSQNTEQALAWMDERCRRIPASPWLEKVAEFPWNAVFTSAVDSVWQQAFVNEWRAPQPIFLEKHTPSDPRNLFQINCTYLFGAVSRIDDAERPPLSRFEWYRRKQTALALARRIPEAVTPIGILFVEGYAGYKDWLKPEDLYGPLSVLLPGQVQLFSATAAIQTDEFVNELVRRGILVLHEERLVDFLQRGSETGKLRLGVRPEEGPLSRQVTIGGDVKNVPRDLWNQLSRSAILLGDAVVQPPASLSKEAAYEEFRAALDTSEGTPKWSAYWRGFFFKRHFERRLWEETQRVLDIGRLVYRPVILHGPTGSGKTVAMGRIALEAKKEGRAVVLYIERKTVRPTPAHIDAFCRWAEDVGAGKCLIVWDGMLDPRDYDQFLGDLTGRGRKVALVGSCYSIEPKHAKTERFVHAEPALRHQEASEFAVYLKSMAPDAQLRADQIENSPSFLVALYRMLTPTRKRIALGVYNETDWSQDRIARRVYSSDPAAKGMSALADAFLRAGLTPSVYQTPDSNLPAFVDTDQTDLTGLIMVPGKYGLSVPLDLLMRALGEKHFSLFADLFEGVDIFRWHEDQQRNISIGARNSLEAKLISDARLGGPKTEIEFVRKLLVEVTEKGGPPSEQHEISFAVDLIKRLRDDVDNSPVLADYFRDLAATLRELRQNRGVHNARLLLQEANMLREWAIDQDRRQETSTTIAERLKTFEDAEGVCRQGLDAVGTAVFNRDLRARLLVELASAIAAKNKHLIATKTILQVIEANYVAVRNTLHDALFADPSNYYAVDVLAWCTEDVLSSGALDEGSAAEATADVLHAFETAPVAQFDLAQLEKYNERRLKFANTIKLNELSDAAFDALMKQGSAAGFYIRAIKKAGFGSPSRTKESRTKDRNVAKYQEALEYLESNKGHIGQDSRCLDLLLDLWWHLHAGGRLFDGERIALPYTQDDWRTTLKIVSDIETGGNSHRPTALAFLRGLALFHLNNIGQALTAFRELERESELLRGPRRIIKSYLASTQQGTPEKFFGEIKWSQGNKGKVFVSKLRNEIDFRPYEFGLQDPRPGTSLGEFHIAFNFRGPIADPAMYYKKPE